MWHSDFQVVCKGAFQCQIYDQLSCKNVPKNQNYIKSLNLNSENREADGDLVRRHVIKMELLK